jgi:hypothetical protein
MEDNYKKLFKSLSEVEPSKELGNRITNFIRTQEKRSAKIKSWIFGSTSAVSFGFSVWAVTILVQSFKSSGFWQYLSLIFSDKIALTYSNEIVLSLIESLPVFGLIIFLSGLGFFVWSITKINYKKYEFQF